jgi:acetolactate synthase regulatory subunit
MSSAVLSSQTGSLSGVGSPRPDAAPAAAAPDAALAVAHDHARQTACFSVHARAEPGIMPRVLELFAKRGLVPSSWHSATSADELTIDIQMRGMPADQADFIAARLRQIADVEVVLTSQKR